MDKNIQEMTALALEKKVIIHSVQAEFEKVVVGQPVLFQRMLSAIISGGHLLLEGVPGLAKTLSIRVLSQILDLDFKRIQFTPDMLPADVRGTMIYSQQKGEFEVKKGPLFTNLLLADEINRAPSKVQSALLESMQEGSATIGETTYKIAEPFFVMATQNPIEQEGTYPLPEAQMDRFYMKISIDYPSHEEEKLIVRRMSSVDLPISKKALTGNEILELRRIVDQIYADDKIVEYIVRLVQSTRTIDPTLIKYGASPRASICFMKAVKVEAFMDGRGYVIPEDVKAVAHDILRHRVILSYEAEAESITPEIMINRILNTVEVP